MRPTMRGVPVAVTMLAAWLLATVPAIGQDDAGDSGGGGYDLLGEFIDAVNEHQGSDYIQSFVRPGSDDAGTIEDPADDLMHSSGAPSGYTPGFVDLRSVVAGTVSFPGDGFVDDLFGGPAGSCDDLRGAVTTAMPGLELLCPDPPPPTPVQEAWSGGIVFLQYSMAEQVPATTPGRCEFVFWFHDGEGPGFQNLDAFPYDPARGMNRATGIGMNPDGSQGTFGLRHPGSGGFEPVPTNTIGLKYADQVGLMVPRSDLNGISQGNHYAFCVEEGVSFAPEDTGADETGPMPFVVDDLPVYELTSAPAPSPTPSPTPTPEPSPTANTAATGELIDEEGGGLPFWILIPIGLLLIGGGVGLRSRERRPEPTDTPTEPTEPADAGGPAVVAPVIDPTDPCARIARLYAEADAEADAREQEAESAEDRAAEAGAVADDARQEAEEACEEAEEAEQRRERAEREAERARGSAGEDEAWMEDVETGERVTGGDVRRRREAARGAWDRYREDPSPESAEELVDEWEELDAPGARDAREAQEEAEIEAADAAAEEAAEAQREAAERCEEAEEAAREAEERAQEAREQAEEARRAADEARARADELKRHLDRCRQLASSGTSTGAGTSEGPGTGVVEDGPGGCYPEGKLSEPKAIDDGLSFRALVGYEIDVGHEYYDVEAARQMADDLTEVAESLGLIGTAMSAHGAAKLFVELPVGQTIQSAATTGFTRSTGIPVPTSPAQFTQAVLENTAKFGAFVADKIADWHSRKADVKITVNLKYQRIDLQWMEVQRCEDGQMVCHERYLVENNGPGTWQNDVFAGRGRELMRPDNARRQADRLASTYAAKFQETYERIAEYQDGSRFEPCGQ